MSQFLFGIRLQKGYILKNNRAWIMFVAKYWFYMVLPNLSMLIYSFSSYWPFILMSTLDMYMMHYESSITKLDTLTRHIQTPIISYPISITTKWCYTIWPPMNQPYSYFFNRLYFHYYTLFKYSWSLIICLKGSTELSCVMYIIPPDWNLEWHLVFHCFFAAK